MSEYITKEELRGLLKPFKTPISRVPVMAVSEYAINAIPAADVEPVVRATWVEKQIKNYNKYYPDGFRCTSIYTCSNCGKKSKTKHARCLHCFAHMERSGSGE